MVALPGEVGGSAEEDVVEEWASLTAEDDAVGGDRDAATAESDGDAATAEGGGAAAPTTTTPRDSRRLWRIGGKKVRAAVSMRSASYALSAQLQAKRLAALSTDDDSSSLGGASGAGTAVPSAIDEEGVPAIVKAAADGDVQELRRLIAILPSTQGTTAAEELDSLRVIQCGEHNINVPDTVLEMLDANGQPAMVDLNHWNDHGQNALIKAVRNNQKRCAQLCLDAGANLSCLDSKFRGAWYYACFGVNIPAGQHKDMVKLLVTAAETSSIEATITPEVVLCTCYTRNVGVTWAVLDALKCEVTSKDSQGNSDFLFHDLHILDNPATVMTWPDGSRTEPGETAVEILASGERIDVLVHHTIRAVLHWKFQQFGRVLMRVELSIYLAWLCAFSVALLLLPSRGVHDTAAATCGRFSEYDSSSVADQCRRVLEIAALAFQVVVCLVHGRDAVRLRAKSGRQVGYCFICGMCMKDKEKQKKRKLRLPTLGGVLMMLPHVTVLWAVVLRVGGASHAHGRISDDQCSLQVSLLVAGNFIGWLRLAEYIMLDQHVGPFFIMVSEMIRRDFVRFMVIPATVLPAFAVAFCVLFNSIGGGAPETDAAAAADAHSNFGNSAFSLVLLGVGLGDDMGETMVAGSDARIMVLLLLYILLVPIMALNLLVAMMAVSTRSSITRQPSIS
jgi:hypothetical protein